MSDRAAPDEVLGEIRASLAHLEAEVAKLRDWRHAIADRFGALAHVPELLLALQSDVRGLREQVSALQREHARQEGERVAVERIGAWIRWGVPALWAAAASFVTWLLSQRGG